MGGILDVLLKKVLKPAVGGLLDPKTNHVSATRAVGVGTIVYAAIEMIPPRTWIEFATFVVVLACGTFLLWARTKTTDVSE